MAQYTPQELTRLQLGHLVRQREQRAAQDAGGHDRLAGRRRELRRGHRQARRQLLEEMNEAPAVG